jgi:hypothetical protein
MTFSQHLLSTLQKASSNWLRHQALKALAVSNRLIGQSTRKPTNISYSQSYWNRGATWNMKWSSNSMKCAFSVRSKSRLSTIGPLMQRYVLNHCQCSSLVALTLKTYSKFVRYIKSKTTLSQQTTLLSSQRTCKSMKTLHLMTNYQSLTKSANRLRLCLISKYSTSSSACVEMWWLVSKTHLSQTVSRSPSNSRSTTSQFQATTLKR